MLLVCLVSDADEVVTEGLCDLVGVTGDDGGVVDADEDGLVGLDGDDTVGLSKERQSGG